jgi:hypothetical protein
MQPLAALAKPRTRPTARAGDVAVQGHRHARHYFLPHRSHLPLAALPAPLWLRAAAKLIGALHGALQCVHDG